MTTKKMVGVLVLALVLIMGYKFVSNTQKTKLNSTVPSSTPVAMQNSDQIVVNKLVNNFYTALELQDGKLLFSYFTEPSTPEEKKDFIWLTGADLTGSPVYRAFFREKISNPKINKITEVDDSTFSVNVSDELTILPSAGSENATYTPQPRQVVFTVIKSSDKWMVDKFTDPSKTAALNTSTTKYSGFNQ